jgi:hypothetical protein
MGRLLIPCISISQLTHPQLEPPPIATPQARLDQIRWLYGEGAKVLLTVRPFLPYVDAREYAEIVSLGAPYSAAVLGGDWYTDLDGTIDSLTRNALGIRKTLLDNVPASRSSLDSSNDTTEWLISKHPDAEILAARAAKLASKEFYMRSADAIRLLRES